MGTNPSLSSDSNTQFDSGLALVALEQERFNRFIWNENERLNRLIRNLYLYLLQFEHYSERDLYDRVCQEVAEYFRASSCELYLVRYEEEEVDQSVHRPNITGMATLGREYGLAKWLELAGAYGQGRRALQRRYVRQADRLRYELPLGSLDKEHLTGMTRLAFSSEDPTRYASGYDHRSTRDEDSKREKSDLLRLRTDSSRQVVWYQDGLHNSFRCSLMAPTFREGRDTADPAQTPNHRRIGLIKVENRLPHGVAGFTELLRSGTDQSYLFFGEEWRIVALRPYVRDLRESVKLGGNPFFPLHNNVGWRQYFDDHPLGAVYFQQLLHELDQKSRSTHHAPSKDLIFKELRDAYRKFSIWLEMLVECLIRLESWVQHLGYACRLLCGLGETPSHDKPIPSLFNVYNLRAAYLPLLLDPCNQAVEGNAESEPIVSMKEAIRLYEAVRDAMFDCLAVKGSKDRSQLGWFEKILHDVMKTERWFDMLSEETWTDSDTQEELKKRAAEWVNLSPKVRSTKLRHELIELSRKFDHLDRSHLSPSDDWPRTREILHESLRTIRVLAEQEAENLIRTLCTQRASAIRAKLDAKGQSSGLSLDIPRALKGTLPAWDFKRAMKEEVLDSLAQISTNLSSKDLIEQTSILELRAEETELRRVRSIVNAILNDSQEIIQRYGAACTLPEISEDHHEEHDDTADIGCKTARALAAAVMYADSFNPLDEKRLVFIASHVTQVLDNYLLHQARQRGLDIDYKALEVLGLEHFGLESIDALWSYTQRMAAALTYLLERELRLA